MSGGSGHWGGYLVNLLSTLAKSKLNDLHIVAIAGASAELKANLEKIEPRIEVRGKCSAEEMTQLTRAADFAGIKAGGATIGECHAVKTIPVVYQKLSGVENGNVDHIKKQNTGIIALQKEQFIATITQLSQYPAKANKILENQNKFPTIGSAKLISQFLHDKVWKESKGVY